MIASLLVSLALVSSTQAAVLGTDQACYGDEFQIAVYSYAESMCYTEDETSDGAYIGTEFRTYYACGSNQADDFSLGCINLSYQGAK